MVWLSGSSASCDLKVAGSIPCQGACGPGPQMWACERQRIDVSHTSMCLSLSSLSLPLTLNIKENLKKKRRKKEKMQLIAKKETYV